MEHSRSKSLISRLHTHRDLCHLWHSESCCSQTSSICHLLIGFNHFPSTIVFQISGACFKANITTLRFVTCDIVLGKQCQCWADNTQKMLLWDLWSSQIPLSTNVGLSKLYLKSMFLENQVVDSYADAGEWECSDMVGLLCCVWESLCLLWTELHRLMVQS